MARILTFLPIVLLLFLPACLEPGDNDRYEHIGTLIFRRSYAGHEEWTRTQLDSVSASNPIALLNHPADDSILRILNEMGLADADQLLLGDNEQDPRDTILVWSHGSGSDKVCIITDTINWNMLVRIKNDHKVYTIRLETADPSPSATLLQSKNSEQPFFAVVRYYYIMNGDNYEVSVYGKPDPRLGEK